MSKKKIPKKNAKNNLKCCSCQFYQKETDFCTEKNIEECSKQKQTDFSLCDTYLVSEKLVMF